MFLVAAFYLQKITKKTTHVPVKDADLIFYSEDLVR